MNVFKTTVLMAVLTVLLMWIGDLVAGRQGVWLFLLIAAAMNFGSYWFSDKIVLAMYRAQPVSQAQAPEVYAVVQGLTERAQIPMPKIYVVPSESPNAFATGRDPHHAAVAVTQGIMRLLNRDELEGVLGHELSHVKNRDTLTSCIVGTMAGAITMLSRSAIWGAMLGGNRRSASRSSNPIRSLFALVLAPIAAMLVQMAMSRTREYAADRSGSQVSGKPLALASALRKLERGVQATPLETANEATAHQFIVNPLRGGLASLFSTHPSTNDRVARLEEIARSMGQLGPTVG